MIKLPLANHALRQLRDATGLTQSEFALRVDMSKPFIQAVEQGTRRANEKLALRAMAVFGVWHVCIRDHWSEAVDLYGNLYSHSTWEKYIVFQEEALSESQLQEYLQPIADLFRAAAVTGKVRVLALLLFESVRELIDINGIGNGLQQVHQKRNAKPTEYSFGKLRGDPLTAGVLNFVDDPTRDDEEIACRVEPVAKKSPSLFSAIYPNPAEIAERYMAKAAPAEEH